MNRIEPPMGGRHGQQLHVSLTQERTGMESLTKSRMDDLLSAEVGKHDYDWLLTPPETPLFSNSEASGNQTSRGASRSRSNARSVSTGKASGLSEKDNSAKAIRSSSTSRSSLSNTYSSSTNLSNSSRTAILNTSTASVTSKPSTPSNSSRTTSSTFSSQSRPSTPANTRDKTKPSQNSRPATLTVRPQAPSTVSTTSSNAAPARSSSRPSTPARRTTAAAPAPALIRSASVGHVPATSNRSNGVAAMRPSSPASQGRSAQAQPLASHDFLPERNTSAGRQRPGTASPVRANSNSASSARKQSSSPIIKRGRLQENSSKVAENKKPMESEPAAGRSIKPASPTESTGSARSVSKKSMEVTHKNMDIKQIMGGIRVTSLFPQSIRSTAHKGRPKPAPPTSDEAVLPDNGASIAVT